MGEINTVRGQLSYSAREVRHGLTSTHKNGATVPGSASSTPNSVATTGVVPDAGVLGAGFFSAVVLLRWVAAEGGGGCGPWVRRPGSVQSRRDPGPDPERMAPFLAPARTFSIECRPQPPPRPPDQFIATLTGHGGREKGTTGYHPPPRAILWRWLSIPRHKRKPGRGPGGRCGARRRPPEGARCWGNWSAGGPAPGRAPRT